MLDNIPYKIHFLILTFLLLFPFYKSPKEIMRGIIGENSREQEKKCKFTNFHNENLKCKYLNKRKRKTKLRLGKTNIKYLRCTLRGE